MVQETETLQLTVAVVGGEEIDDADLAEMTRSLQSELKEVEGINQVTEAQKAGQEKGTKGFEWIGELLIKIVPSGIGTILGFLKEWIKRPGSRPVKITATGRNGKKIEVEFDPKTITAKKVQEFALALQESVNK